MADANLTGLRYIEENTWGITPDSPQMQELRITNEDLSYNISTVTSSEIRDDRQITDQVSTATDPGGSVSFELSYDAYDEWLEGALWGDWIGVGGGATEIITAAASTSDFTLSSSANTITFGSSVTHAILPGQWIRLNGSTADDGYHLVTSVTGQILTVASITTAESLNSGETIKGAYLRNGIVRHSYSIERKINTTIDQYFLWKGMTISKADVNIGNQSILTGSFTFIGSDETAGTTLTASGVTDATTNDVMSAPVNVASIQEADTEINTTGVYVQSVNFSIDNGLRGVKDITSAANQAVGAGSCNVTGNLSLLFDNLTIYNKLKNATSSSLSFRLEEGTADEGNCYIFYLPKIKYSTGTVSVPGTNQDIPQEMSWQGLRHATYDFTIQVCKFDTE